MKQVHADLVILGGGCAGLSLGRELSLLEKEGRRIPRTVILESKPSSFSSKTWCHWRPTGQEDSIPVARKWNEWTFSSDKERIHHSTRAFEYVCVRGEDFFRNALEYIRQSQMIHLQTGTRVTSVDDSGPRFRIQLPDKEIFCHQIVDTRPPDPGLMEKCILFQSFAGFEVTTPGNTISTRSVGLMESMTTDKHGFRFDYSLPLNNNRMLIEATRFSPDPLSETQLLRDLSGSLSRILPDGNFKIHRQEYGVIPMGLPEPARPANPNWVLAGTAGGAVRPASGYAFADIQEWAQACAQSLVGNGVPVGHRGLSGMLRQMDMLFLCVLSRNPGIAPDLFLSMASNLDPGRFVRFMTGNAHASDLLAVVRSLPARPFLQEIGHKLASPARFDSKPVLSQ